MKNAKDIPALKAISQNLMHANLSVTDGIYGILSDMDVKQQISTLGRDLGKLTEKKELISLLRNLIKEYDDKR